MSKDKEISRGGKNREKNGENSKKLIHKRDERRNEMEGGCEERHKMDWKKRKEGGDGN